MLSRFDAAARIVADAVAARAFPAATTEVGRGAGVLWRASFGTLTYDEDAPPATVETVFDLASLTKVIATTSVVMRLVDEGRLGLDQRVADWLPGWRGPDREHVTLHDLLAHCSGLTPHLPLYESYEGRAEFEPAICDLPLDYPPRSKSMYSDLGFVLLAFVAEDAAGARLDAQFDAVRRALGIAELVFRPPHVWQARTAPTGVDSWRGRLLAGEVHDQNAWALGGVAGHAGLFGTAPAVGTFARAVLDGLRAGKSGHAGPAPTAAGEVDAAETRRPAAQTAADGRDEVAQLPRPRHDPRTSRAPAVRMPGGAFSVASPDTLRRFARRTRVPGSSRALGWDTMLPTSSCGTRMSPTAIGHTGFTGTSLWIDWEADLYAVLLTNRVHPAVGNDAIVEVRRAFHDALAG